MPKKTGGGHSKMQRSMLGRLLDLESLLRSMSLHGIAQAVETLPPLRLAITKTRRLQYKKGYTPLMKIAASYTNNWPNVPPLAKKETTHFG